MLNVLYLAERIDPYSFECLPHLAKHAAVHLISSRSSHLPKTDFASVTEVPPTRFIFHQILPLTWQAMKVLNRQTIDVIHVEGHAGFLLPTRVPMVVHDQGCWRDGWKQDVSSAQGTRKLRYYATVWLHFVAPEMVSIRRAEHLITVSRSAKEVLQQEYHLKEEMITAVPFGVPAQLENFPFLKSEQDPPQLIFTGRLHPSKGILEFTRLFSQFCHIPVNFTIVGTGQDRAALEEIAHKDPRLTLTGFLPRSEVYQHLTSSNIFVFPSLHEGFGLSVLEAMATGHACVTLDIPPIRETLGLENGRLCGSMGEMLEAIVELCNKPERRYTLQRKALDRSREFSWERNAERIVQVYKTTANRRCTGES